MARMAKRQAWAEPASPTADQSQVARVFFFARENQSGLFQAVKAHRRRQAAPRYSGSAQSWHQSQQRQQKRPHL